MMAGQKGKNMARVTKRFYSVYWKGQLQIRFDNLRGAQAWRRSFIKDLMKGRLPGDRERTEREVEIREEIYTVDEVQTPMGKRYEGFPG